MTRPHKLAQHSQIAKSVRVCLKCQKLTTFGYNSRVGHSACCKCGNGSNKAIFVRWANPRLVPDEWKNRECRLSKKELADWINKSTKK